jgi:hypothetical protein
MVAQNSLVSRSLEELSIQEDEDSQHEVIKDVACMAFIGTTEIIFFLLIVTYLTFLYI